MTAKEIDRHLQAGMATDQRLGNFTLAEQKNFKLCAAWGYVSPVIRFIVDSKILKFLKPKWVVAINVLIAAFDAGCDISSE